MGGRGAVGGRPWATLASALQLHGPRGYRRKDGWRRGESEFAGLFVVVFYLPGFLMSLFNYINQLNLMKYFLRLKF